MSDWRRKGLLLLFLHFQAPLLPFALSDSIPKKWGKEGRATREEECNQGKLLSKLWNEIEEGMCKCLGTDAGNCRHGLAYNAMLET